MDNWQHSLACELRDYPEWHKGRQRYAVWVLSIDSEAIQHRLQSARHLLQDWVHPVGERQAHITLFVCGFPARYTVHDDDFSQSQLEQQRQALKQLNAHPFQLQIGGAASFSSAAYLQVHDPAQGLARIRKALSNCSHEIRQSPYTPHLTIGLYQKAIDRSLIEQRLALVESQPLELKVLQLHYATYQADAQHGQLDYEQSWRLRCSISSPAPHIICP